MSEEIRVTTTRLVKILRRLISSTVVSRLVRTYAAFAVVNTLLKFWKVVYFHVKTRRAWRNVPGESIDPLGLRLSANVYRIFDFYLGMANKHPRAPLVKTCFPYPELICNTPESVEWMLKTEFDVITKLSGDEDLLSKTVGEFIGEEGIFAMRHGDAVGDDHAKWYKQRKLASLIFTKRNMGNLMYETFLKKSEILCQILDQAAEKGETVDMQEKFFSFTMDSIETIFFGEEVNSLAGEMSKYAQSFDGAHRWMIKYINAYIPIEILSRSLLPYPFGKIYDNANKKNSGELLMKLIELISPSRKKFDNCVKELDNHVFEIIKRAREDPNIKNRRDLMSLFVNTKINDEEGLDDKTLRDVILNLTIAGRDTTACTLTWMFYMLSQNPEVQKQLQEEIDSKLLGQTPTPKDLEPQNMPYLNGVLYETLRLYPPVPLDLKVTQTDLTYLDGTFIPKGTRLLFSPYANGRNETRYQHPLKVDPTRWIPFKQPSLFDFPVFQAGPRYCLGKDMAQFEAKLVATTLLQRFSFTLEDSPKNITYALMITMALSNDGFERKTHNLWLKPHRRQQFQSELLAHETKGEAMKC